MTPLPSRAFRSWRTPATLNVAAVGASLATVTGVSFHLLWPETYAYATISTFIMGTLWAAAVRVKPKKGIRMGWLLSPVFACVNAMLCLFLMIANDGTLMSFGGVLGILLAGAIVGAMVWIPALVLTLLLFGLPIARAQSLAARGLAGVDRGEIIVGLVSAALATIGVVFSRSTIEVGFGVAAVAAGLVATVLSLVRERARRAFVKRVEAGAVDHFRVDETPEGKVLVRVTTTGMAYRVSDFVEEIATLSNEGEVLATSRIAL
jgi:hypothetical protein